MDYRFPPGLLGFRTEFLKETRGTGHLHHVSRLERGTATCHATPGPLADPWDDHDVLTAEPAGASPLVVPG